MLISLYTDHHTAYKSLYINKLWKFVASKMQEKGYNVDETQVGNKWKHVSTYKKVKENNNTSGNGPSTCAFYEELD